MPKSSKSESVAFAVMTRDDGQPAAGCLDPAITPADLTHCIVAKRELRFIPQVTLTMRVDLRRSCLGIVCATDQTCVKGGCVGAELPAGSCAPQCGESALDGGVATSCQAVLAGDPGATSGVYTIAPAGSAPFQVYCDMTDSGGGWTLVLKIDGTGNPAMPQTFSYEESIWTDSSTLNPSSTDMSRTEAKFLSFSTMPFTSMLGMMSGATATNQLVIPVGDPTSMQDLMASPVNTVTTHLGRAAWVGLTNPTAMPQLNCNAEGINVWINSASNPRQRIGLVTNNETDCSSPDSNTGFGGQNYECGENFGPSAGSAGGACQMGGLDVLNFGYVFIR